MSGLYFSISSSKEQALQRRREIRSKIKRSEFDLTASQKEIDDELETRRIEFEKQMRELRSKKDRLRMDHERNLFELNEELDLSDESVCDDSIETNHHSAGEVRTKMSTAGYQTAKLSTALFTQTLIRVLNATRAS